MSPPPAAALPPASEEDGYAPALKADDAILFLERVLEKCGVEAFETEEYIELGGCMDVLCVCFGPPVPS